MDTLIFRRARRVLLIGAGLALVALPFAFGSMPESVGDSSWERIAGCGAGGGGGAAGAGKWIGRGATGGAVDLEILSNRTIGGDYQYDALAANLSHKTLNAGSFSLGLSWKSNTFEIDPYKTSSDYSGTKTQVTGGFGDLSLGWSKGFGDVGQYSGSVTLSLPTGQHDIKRIFSNGDNFVPWMPPEAQPGSGHYSLTGGLERTIDKDWGLFVLGGSYTASFARDISCGSSSNPDTRLAECQDEAPEALTWRIWELHHNLQYDYHGAPGTGATQPDAASLYAHVAYREETAFHSLGATLSLPMGPSIHWDKGPSGVGSLRVASQDVTLKLSYGLEVSLNPQNYPLFFSVGLPYRIWKFEGEGREWSPIPTNYILTAGFRGTFL